VVQKPDRAGARQARCCSSGGTHELSPLRRERLVVEEDGRIEARDRRAGRVAAAEATLELGQRLKDRTHVSLA